MAELPRYGTQTPRVNAPDIGVHRMRGLEDATFAALQGSRTAADVSEYFMRQVERANINEAEQAGAVVARDDAGNLKPIALRNSSSPSALAFNNAQRQAWAAAVSADAASALKGYAHAALNPRDASGNPLPQTANPIDVFDKQASGYIAAAFRDKNIPDDVRSSLVTRIGQVAAEHRTWVVDNVHKRNVDKIQGELDAESNRLVGEAISYARSGNAASVERSRAAFVAAVSGIADINPAYTKDKQDAAIKTFDAAVYFTDVERKALGAFNGSAAFRESGLGRAAGIRVVDAAMNDAIARFGPDLANAWMNRINAKIQLESSTRDAVDAVTMRRAEDAYLAANIKFGQPVIAALKNNGENPQTVLQQQSELIYEQFKNNPQLARLFQNRFIQNFREKTADWDPGVIGADKAQSEWFSSIKAAVARGDIDPESVVPMMLNKFESGELPYDPRFEAQTREYASNAGVQEVNRDRSEARSADRAFQTEANAQARVLNRLIEKEKEHAARVLVVRDVLDGKGNPLAVNSDAAIALDEVWAGWGFKIETHAPMMAEMMLRGGGMSAAIKDDIKGLMHTPTEGVLRKYGRFLGLVMSEPNLRAGIIDQTFSSAEDRAKLGRMWGELQQHAVNLSNAGGDLARKDVEMRRFAGVVTDMRREFNDSRIAGPEVRSRIPNFDAQAGAAASRVTDELSKIGVDALDGWFGLSTTPGRRVFSGAEQSMRPFQEGYSLSYTATIVEKAVTGLSLIFGRDPFSGLDVAAGLPLIGLAFETAPTVLNPVDKAILRNEVESRALANGGDIDAAASQAQRSFSASGRAPSFYSGANNAKALDPNAKYVAEWAPHPIDGGPGGPMMTRGVLHPLADRFIKEGGRFADPSVTTAAQAVSKPGLWNVKFDSFGEVERDGRKIQGRSYDVRIMVHSENGAKDLVPVGKVFVPTINDAQLQRIREDAEAEATNIVNDRIAQRIRDRGEPPASMPHGMSREQFQRQMLDPLRGMRNPDGAPMTDRQVVDFVENRRNYNEVKGLAKWLEIGMIVDLARSGSASPR